jgi:hypothetical protein
MAFGHKNDNAGFHKYMWQVTTFNGGNGKEMARNNGGNFR